jgi:hypothetical protein
MEVVLSGNYAYVVDETSGLKIIDVNDPTTPTLVGSYDTPNNAQDVAIFENYAYVTYSGLVSSLLNPNFKNSYNTSEFVRKTILSSEMLGTRWRSGFHVINITNPENPIFKGSYDDITINGDLYGIVVAGNYAYVAAWQAGLQIVDITNSTNPTYKSSYDTPDRAYGIDFSKNYAYMTNFDSGLQIIAPNLDKLNLSGVPNAVGKYNVYVKACNEARKCVTDNFSVIVTNFLPTNLITLIIGSIIGTVYTASFCCVLIGGGLVALKRYRNKILKGENNTSVKKLENRKKWQKLESKISNEKIFDNSKINGKKPLLPE